MHCITVFPILKTTFADTLTYWTKETCQVGDVIKVKIQNRDVWAVVDSLVPIQQAKDFIKSQTFVIKKIEKIVKTNAFSREFILSVLDTAQYYVKPFGEVFSELVPKKTLENLDVDEEKVIQAVTTTHKTKPQTTYFQGKLQERVHKIQEISTENTFIVSPTQTHAKFLKSQGLKNIILPIDLYKIDQVSNPSVILDSASSEYYRHLRKDFDIRYFIRAFATRKHIYLTEMDTLLPLYVHEVIDKLNFVIPNKPKLHMVDLTESGKAKTKSKENFTLNLKHFSPELLTLIKHCESNNQSILLYTVRKGLHSQTICSDCATVVFCPTCKNPLELKENQNKDKFFVCNTCNAIETANRSCINCGGWNLISLGASTESVREELERVTDLPIVIIDSNNQTKATAAKLLKNKETAAIYIGTELLLTQSQSETFDYSAVISLESLLALPSRTAEFDAARVIYTLMERTTSDVLIQTRNPKHPLWKAVKEKDWQPLITTIRDTTKQLLLPPFCTHVQIHSKSNTDTIYTYLKKYVTVLKTQQKDKTVLHIFFKPQEWPNSIIYPYLKSLPKNVIVDVDRTNFL